METTFKTNLVKDLDHKRLIINRAFKAPLEKVWTAWTDSKALDQWWAPKPWKAKTKTQDFKEGGYWLYAMTGPDGTEVWARIDYITISSPTQFTAVDSFCDEKGNPNKDFPSINWKCDFSNIENGTNVKVEMTFKKVEDIQKIIEMGFQEGFAMAHGNLDELLAAL